MSETPCPRCEQLRAELQEAREQRDAALLALAVEREMSNAIVLGQARAVPAPPPRPPLRYRVVDALNEALKKALPWPHAALRATARVLRRGDKAEP